jgi:hypothetical protein
MRFVRYMTNVNVVPKRAESIQNDVINTRILSFYVWVLMAAVLELNCHTLCPSTRPRCVIAEDMTVVI